jgi:hypothetical protein
MDSICGGYNMPDRSWQIRSCPCIIARLGHLVRTTTYLGMAMGDQTIYGRPDHLIRPIENFGIFRHDKAPLSQIIGRRQTPLVGVPFLIRGILSPRPARSSKNVMIKLDVWRVTRDGQLYITTYEAYTLTSVVDSDYLGPHPWISATLQ